jgi:hypothetical protein
LSVLPIQFRVVGGPFGARIQILRKICCRNHVSVPECDVKGRGRIPLPRSLGAVWNSGSVPENPKTNANQAASRIHIVTYCKRLGSHILASL